MRGPVRSIRIAPLQVGVGGPLHIPLVQPLAQLFVVVQVLLLQLCTLELLQRSATCVPPVHWPAAHDDVLATMH